MGHSKSVPIELVLLFWNVSKFEVALTGQIYILYNIYIIYIFKNRTYIINNNKVKSEVISTNLS